MLNTLYYRIMDIKKKKITNKQVDEIPTIVVECPAGSKLPYLDAEQKEASNSKENETNKINSAQRRTLRRNSISLPNLENYEIQIVKDNNVSSISGAENINLRKYKFHFLIRTIEIVLN